MRLARWLRWLAGEVTRVPGGMEFPTGLQIMIGWAVAFAALCVLDVLCGAPAWLWAIHGVGCGCPIGIAVAILVERHEYAAVQQ